MRHRRAVVAWALAVGLLAVKSASQAALTIADAWGREPGAGRLITAAYAVVGNPGAAEIQIVGASADAAGSVEMHEMIRSGDMMKMAPVQSVTVPARGTMAFKPGGTHLMLFELKRDLKDGDTVALTFTTSTGSRVKATATVKKAMPQ